MPSIFTPLCQNQQKIQYTAAFTWESRCILDSITLSLSILGCTGCVGNSLLYGIKQLCNTFLWDTMEYPTCQLYFAGIHARLIQIEKLTRGIFHGITLKTLDFFSCIKVKTKQSFFASSVSNSIKVQLNFISTEKILVEKKKQ